MGARVPEFFWLVWHGFRLLIRLEPGSFDAVAAFNVLLYLPDLPAALARIRELLKPGGQAPLGEKGHIGHRSGVAFHQLFQANGGGPGPQAVGGGQEHAAGLEQLPDAGQGGGKIYAETNDKTARRSLQYLKPTDRVLEFACGTGLIGWKLPSEREKPFWAMRRARPRWVKKAT